MSLSLTASTTAPALGATVVVDLPIGRQRLEEDIVALFDQLRDPLMRYLSGIGLTIPDGEEVIQEAFLSLFQHLRSGKPRDNLRGWLFRVAHNLALKRRYRNRRSLEVLATVGIFDGVDPEPSTEQRLINDATQQRLVAVLEALPDQDRRCLLLRAEGLRYREIGEILDMSLGAVSLSLTRTLARIARATQR